MLNRNIGCIEIQISEEHVHVNNQLNRNIGCIEMVKAIFLLREFGMVEP